MSAKYFVCFLEITNSTSRIAVIVRNPVSKSTFCLNLTNTAFYADSPFRPASHMTAVTAACWAGVKRITICYLLYTCVLHITRNDSSCMSLYQLHLLLDLVVLVFYIDLFYTN
jgi:hypothetical protein